MLTEQQIQCIDYLILGTMKKKEIARLIGCTDRVIYKWEAKSEFREEWHRRSMELKTGIVEEAQSLLASKLGQAIANVVEIANDQKIGAKIRLEANMYLINRILGNTSSRISTETKIEKTEESFDIDCMAEAI